MIFVLMGIAGSGKTTVGTLLAERLGWRFMDADDFHPAANVAKMARGEPLDDGDRAPWLEAMRAALAETIAKKSDVVLACSALKQGYRDRLSIDPAMMRWVYLKGDTQLLAARLAGRKGHFMKAGMLDSQITALEEPVDALTVDVANSPEEIVDEICRRLAW